MDRATRTVMSRKLVWIEQRRFRGFGCSECAWVFNPSSAPNFELQRDKEFTLHVCADHPGARTLNNSECQDWGKLYRAAVLESDRSRLLQRIEQAEAAILERSRSLSKSPACDISATGLYFNSTTSGFGLSITALRPCTSD